MPAVDLTPHLARAPHTVGPRYPGRCAPPCTLHSRRSLHGGPVASTQVAPVVPADATRRAPPTAWVQLASSPSAPTSPLSGAHPRDHVRTAGLSSYPRHSPRSRMSSDRRPARSDDERVASVSIDLRW